MLLFINKNNDTIFLGLETFTVVSQRLRGYPFSLTFYLNGLQAERLSACCEYKHKVGYKLGSKSGYFGFVKISGAYPCFR